MTDRPIIMSAPMVRALPEKTMTRRVYNGRVEPHIGLPSEMREDLELKGFDLCGENWAAPRFAVGDRLWVRESYALMPRTAYILPKTISADDAHEAAYYRADFDRSGHPRWRPSIHMPRWASRWTLIVESVKVERLNDISEEDARREGIRQHDAHVGKWVCPSGECGRSVYRSAADAFAALWEGLHGAGAWKENPWVVAIGFAPVRGNIDTL